jgi:CRISPR/Cas system CSM-associated protein Csm3 (group 7 of RAMP superfamily)
MYLSVTISIDRFISSEMPLRSRDICIRKSVFKITIIYLILFSLFWSFYLIPMSREDPITGLCF